MHLSTEIAVMI